MGAKGCLDIISFKGAIKLFCTPGTQKDGWYISSVGEDNKVSYEAVTKESFNKILMDLFS